MIRNSFTVRRTTAGLGLFTLKPISARKRIIEYVGSIIPLEDAKSRSGKYLFQLDEKRAIDGSQRSNIARYINHSCRPNAEAVSVKCQIWIYAKKALLAGEEITIDYGREYFDELIKPNGCKCKRCQ
jgi:hypothetical protein